MQPNPKTLKGDVGCRTQHPELDVVVRKLLNRKGSVGWEIKNPNPKTQEEGYGDGKTDKPKRAWG